MSASTALVEHPIRDSFRPAVRVWLRCLWVALVLWLASNALVTMVATIATWEGVASYKRMADLCQWDCVWYGKVVDYGYDKAPSSLTTMTNWPFHPLFPISAYPLRYWFKLSLRGSVVLAGKLELLLAIYAFLLLVSNQARDTADYFRAGSLVAFNPYVIYAHGGYAEPLYFALIALAFYFAERRRWIWSGAMGGLASATRIVGCAFAGVYCLFWARSLKRRIQWRKIDLDAVIGLFLCPLGTGLFMLYLYHHLGDAFAQEHAHVAWAKVPGNPLQTIWTALLTTQWPFAWGLMAVAALLFSAWLVYLRKAELGIFLAISVLIPFSAGWGSAPRYIWWQPPFLYAIYCILKRHGGAWLIYTACSTAMACFMIIEWFSGHGFVI